MALTSLWEDRRPRNHASARPLSVSGRAWDVVVVGAGLTGLTTALLLARAGLEVLVLESYGVGSGTTGRSTAKLSLLQGTHLSKLAGRHTEDVVEQYVTGNREALAWLLRYCAEHEVAVQRRTSYTYATTERGEHAARAEHRAARDAGLEVRWESSTDLPFRTRGAVALEDQAQLDPLELVDALAADVRRHGGTIAEGTPVRSVSGRGPVRVRIDDAEVEADRVVLATNMPILDRGGFFGRAVPARSYGLAFATPERAVDGMYLSADSPGRSLRDAPAADGGDLLLVGGNGHTTGRTRSPRSRVADLQSWTATHFPDAEVTHTWSAQDYVTASGLPYVGRLSPRRDDLLVAGGYSKWGMTNGVAAALALSSRILRGHTPWADVLDPWSRHAARGLPDATLANAEVGLELTRGWIRPVTGLTHRTDPVEGQGRVKIYRVGLPTAVSRVHGQVHRVSAVCPHLGGILRWNDAELSWDCPLHGSRFGPAGELLEGPATCGLGSHEE
ncbi:FAD-dependent oxidoreductase [Nocardioides donggukensis]|uniref:FAD-dependent oxidoreductase n=1 Tax=Nocardioides donggukensis TaxID=2774019 RepID=UPI00191E2769|nr:FAD-dependent oxidoreductase [Nocardioides donggukensis]